MSRLRVTGKQLLSALRKGGFATIRTRGSHQFVRHPDGRTTVIPIHAGETIGAGLLNQIPKDTELTKEELRKLL